ASVVCSPRPQPHFVLSSPSFVIFFSSLPASPHPSPLSLHDALPICCHLKNIWTAPLPPETELSRQMTTSTTSIDIMGLQAQSQEEAEQDRKSGSAGMPRPISYAVFCLKKKTTQASTTADPTGPTTT